MTSDKTLEFIKSKLIEYNEALDISKVMTF